MAWKDVSNFAESKVMRLEREREDTEGGRGGYMGRRGDILRYPGVRGEIDFVYIPILSPAVFYSVIVGGEGQKWTMDRGGACIIRKDRERKGE